MANEKHLKLLKQGEWDWNRWRKKNTDVRPDLSQADLSGADLSDVDLTGADLVGADLRQANLTTACLHGANLSGANLRAADLLEADLSEAIFSGADLREAMLVGVDLKKDPQVLHAAYNDAQGVTAEFNLNLLRRINRELAADFDLDMFRHVAFYDAAAGRIEMHLESLRAQTVTVSGRTFAFAAGERMHTENSCKYSVEQFQRLAQAAGFRPAQVWVDADRQFAVHLLRA